MKLNGTYTDTMDYNGHVVDYTVSVSCDYYYRPGRMYMRNGDPGYPEEESYDDLEVTGIDSVTVYDDNGDEIDVEVPDDVVIANAETYAEIDDCNWDDPSSYDPDDYEPDYEPDYD